MTRTPPPTNLFTQPDEDGRPVTVSFGRGRHPNSRAAFRGSRSSSNARCELIVGELTKRGPGTDREILHRLGWGEDLNKVRPRITELKDAGRVIEIGKRKCSITGKTVRVVGLREQGGNHKHQEGRVAI